ncbi:MAG: hypothetical protein ACTHK4_15445 [Mycobacteriales bacterium]
MYRRTATAVVALTATAGLLAGCGGGSSSGAKTNTGNLSASTAAGQLAAAVSALGQAKTLTVSLKVDATSRQVLRFEQQRHAALTAKQAAAIAGATVTLEVVAPSGKTISQISGLSSVGGTNISLVDNGANVLSLRAVGQTAYLQLNLKDLLTALNQDQMYRQIVGAGTQLPAFLSAAVHGKWISLPLSTLAGVAPRPTATSSAQSSQFIEKLKALLTNDVTVTKTTSGGTDTYTLTANIRTFAGDFKSGLGGSIPGLGSVFTSTKVAKLPNRNVTMTATVTGGALTGLTIDLGQLTTTGHGTLPLQMGFAQSGPAITAPSGAVAVDPTQLTQILGAFGGGL